MKHKSYYIEAMRYIPVASAGMMMLHCICLLLGIKEYITEILLICMGFLLAENFSRALGYCTLHRCLIHYSYAVMICVWWERYGPGFGDDLTRWRAAMVTVGACLFTLLAMKKLNDKV